VGLWFHQSHWQGANLSFVDSTIREIEAQGANVLPVFFSGSKNQKLGINGLEWVIDNYFKKDGKPLVDVVVSLFSFSFTTCLSGAEASGLLKNSMFP
jgi:cobaltochelatase CobN